MPRRRYLLAPAVIAPALLVALTTGPADAANVLNYTMHVPGVVKDNPCSPGTFVNLNGDVHGVITSVTDKAGGVRTTYDTNTRYRGVSVPAGTTYVGSETSH